MVKSGQKIKRTRLLQHAACLAVEALGTETGAFRIATSECGGRFPRGGDEWDVVLRLVRDRTAERITLLVECREYLSPKNALALLASRRVPRDAKLLLFSPAISKRVADICRERNVGYLDAAGNCLLQAEGLFIERSGRGNARPDTRPVRRLFAPKASRIVRVMLTEPRRRWQVQELARAARVSLGLAAKVKETLVTEGYAIERDRLLLLASPRALLDAWSRVYAPPGEQIDLHVPDKAADVAVARWLEANAVRYGLTQLAGAARAMGLAPVREFVFWMERPPPAAWATLQQQTTGERVESDGNVVLWLADDEAVFDGVRLLGGPPLATVSPLQLYLDLRLLDDGGLAADELFEHELSARFLGC